MSQSGTNNAGVFPPGTVVETITGNSGGSVPADGANNINIVGAGQVTVTGNPGNNTLTISDSGAVADSFVTDSGTATPAAGVLNLNGGNNIGTTGAGSTVHINVTGTTNHAVQVGNASGSLTSVAVGTTGQVLTGVTGSDPTFQAPAASSISITGDSGGALTGNAFTFTGAATGLTFAGSGSTETLGGTLAIANGGTNAASMSDTDGVVYFDGTMLATTSVGSATEVLTSNGPGLAPTFQAASGGGVSGPGSSTDRAISTWNGTGGNALFDNPTVQISSAGIMTNSTQPAFLANLATSQTNATGNGASFVIPYADIKFNQGSGYGSGTGIFTAPVAGIYQFNMTAMVQGVDALMTTGQININTTQNQFNLAYLNPFVPSAAGTFYQMSGSTLAIMAAGDTATFSVIITGGAGNTVTILGNTMDPANQGFTFVSGFLVC